MLGCRVEQAVATTATLDLEAVRAGLPLACLLPADLDLQLLHDPPYKLVFDHARQKLHFLCVKSSECLLRLGLTIDSQDVSIVNFVLFLILYITGCKVLRLSRHFIECQTRLNLPYCPQ